jgi:transcriptional regulator with XRE-family HTH domain
VDAARVTREARGRAGLTQRELARSAGMQQPAIARIETGDVVPRADTLARLLAACGLALTIEPRLPESEDWARTRGEIRALLRVTPRQRLLSLPRKSGSRFSPLELARILAGRRVRFVLVGEVAARVLGAPLSPGMLEIAAQPARLNAERLARAFETLSQLSRPGSRLPASLRDLRGRGQLRTRFGIIEVWWPADETYRRLEGAATETNLGTRPVLAASVDDLIQAWRGGADERQLLAVVREEMDWGAVQRRKKRTRSGRTRQKK